MIRKSIERFIIGIVARDIERGGACYSAIRRGGFVKKSDAPIEGCDINISDEPMYVWALKPNPSRMGAI